MADILFPLATEVMFTAPDNPRAVRPEALVEIAGRGRTAVDIGEALALARRNASAEDVVVVSGSLFLVGEARALLSGDLRQKFA
jgi:dihydrofolate synthase / folylpolyglutamate synthase